MEKYRYFTLREKGEISEYYRVWENKYEWWDSEDSLWNEGIYETWTKKCSHVKNNGASSLQETSPLEMVVLLGKEAIRMMK